VRITAPLPGEAARSRSSNYQEFVETRYSVAVIRLWQFTHWAPKFTNARFQRYFCAWFSANLHQQVRNGCFRYPRSEPNSIPWSFPYPIKLTYDRRAKRLHQDPAYGGGSE
jgi:hypothetical protein